MIKLSITLPSGGGIALEADDRELVREVLHSAMPHLLLAPPAGNGSANGVGGAVNGSGNGQRHNGVIPGNGIIPGATLTETPPPSYPAHANGDYPNGEYANGAGSGDNGNGYAHAYAQAGENGSQDSAGGNGVGTDPSYPTMASPAPANLAPAPSYLLPPTPQAPPQPGGAPASVVATTVPAYPVAGAPAAHAATAPAYPVAGAPASPAATTSPVSTSPVPAPTATTAAVNPMPAPAADASSPAERQFAAYCQQINPIGDMRRVVVAAEAAARYLEIPSVDPDRLAALFTLAGWSIPHSFVQTLRNAARSKFRWMERVPGLNGHYRVSDVGRSIVLGESGTPPPPA